MASFYLDGRRQPERRAVAYLNPRSSDYALDGKVYIKHRLMRTKESNIEEHDWIFREKPIESAFDELVLESNNTVTDGEILTKALESSQLKDAEGDETKTGQILIELRRVIIGEKYMTHQFEPEIDEKSPDARMKDVEGDLAHTTGFEHRRSLPQSKPFQVVEYSPWKFNEGVWASFLFFYRSRGKSSSAFSCNQRLMLPPEQLKRFGFPGFPTMPERARRRYRTLDNCLINMIPLSILKPEETEKVGMKKVVSFEDKTKRKTPNNSRISTSAEKAFQFQKTLDLPLRNLTYSGKFPKPIAPLELSRMAVTSSTIDSQSLHHSLHLLNQESLEMPGASRFTLRSRVKQAYKNSIVRVKDHDWDVSQPATKSGLGLLPGAPDIPEKPNPAEKENSQKDLRMELKAVLIRKRTHDKVEEEAAEEAASRHAVASNRGLDVVKEKNYGTKGPTHRNKKPKP